MCRVSCCERKCAGEWGGKAGCEERCGKRVYGVNGKCVEVRGEVWGVRGEV